MVQLPGNLILLGKAQACSASRSGADWRSIEYSVPSTVPSSSMSWALHLHQGLCFFLLPVCDQQNNSCPRLEPGNWIDSCVGQIHAS